VDTRRGRRWTVVTSVRFEIFENDFVGEKNTPGFEFFVRMGFEKKIVFGLWSFC
jgi:hypothetical protein